MTYTLPLSITPRPGESLPGFLVRLAVRSPGWSVKDLGKRTGLRQPGSALELADLLPLATLAGFDPRLLADMCYPPSARSAHHRFLGIELHREQLDLHRRRQCPLCLDDADHHRAVWDLSLAGCCPIHGVYLLSKCERCGTRLGWSASSLLSCHRCGADLLTQPTVRCEHATTAACQDFMDIASTRPLSWLPHALVGAERSDLVRLVIVLGMVAGDWERPRRPETVAETGPVAAAGVVENGITILRNWPSAMSAALERAAATGGPRKGRFGARHALGHIYSTLAALPVGPIRDAVAVVARGLIATDAVSASRLRRSRLLLASAEESSALCLTEAARALGTTTTRIKRLGRAGALDVEGVEGRGLPAAVDPATVRRLADLQMRSVNMRQAAALLGISRTRVSRLVEGGLLKAVHRAVEDRLGTWAFDAREIAALQRRLETGITPAGGGKVIGFEAAVEAFRRRGVGLQEFLQLVLDAKLRVAGIDATSDGLKRLQFSADCVHKLCRGAETNATGMTVQAAAELLDLKWEQVRHCISIGMLHSETSGILLRDVRAFQQTYVAASELARLEQTSPRMVIARLFDQGVRPVTGPGVDHGRKAFFRRGSLVSSD